MEGAGYPTLAAPTESLWNWAHGVAAGPYRYKLSPLASFDPVDASGYGMPTTLPAFTFARAGERYVVSAVSEADFHPDGIDPLALHLAVFW